MTISVPQTPLRRRLGLVAAALAAVAALGGFSAGSASAESAPAADQGGADASELYCWKEYEFYRSGNTLYATGYKDCVNLTVAEKLPVTIQMWYSDEYGNTGWMNVASGSGTATTACKSYWPAWYRHSVTKEQIYC